MGDIIHRLLPVRKFSHHSKEEVKRGSANCKGTLVLHYGLTGSDLVNWLWAARW